MKILESIVVEGRDDQSAVLAAVEANIICTHGYGISGNTLALIEAAYNKNGIIIFTDPDHAGEAIRRRLSRQFPNAKQAYLIRELAEKNGDIGIENASPESIRYALKKAKACSSEGSGEFTMDDMLELGLAGLPGSAQRRAALGMKLGIGNANCKSFLKRLNLMGFTKEELYEANNQ